MKFDWPETDVVEDVRVDAGGRSATARTNLYLQGTRRHIHTTTILIATDLLLSRLLRPGERLPDIVELHNRKVSNRNLLLTAAESSDDIRRRRSPAMRARFRTNRGRTLCVEGTVCDDPVRRRSGSPGLFVELMSRMRLEGSRDGTHRTRLGPLQEPWAGCRDPILQRSAIIEFVLEGTRELIHQQFGELDRQALVVAGWKGFVFPRWEDVAPGCVLEYRLGDGRLPSGGRLVHCDFSFARHVHSGRLTIASIPSARLTALEAQAERLRAAGDDRAAPNAMAAE